MPNIPPKFLNNRNQINFVIAHVSNKEILDIINFLEIYQSSGPSSIPMKMLSVIPDLIISPLAYIINMSFVTGVYPDLLKIVKRLFQFTKVVHLKTSTIIDLFHYYQFLIK